MSLSERALGRLISALEHGSEEAEELLAARWNGSRMSQVVGFSGPPGVGKSVLVGRLAADAARRGQRVAVLAVDPTSLLTGGAVLADRVRMQAHSASRDVFIRSLASRGVLGGLSRVVPAAIRALEAAGYEAILIETVGVGQNETEIADIAETVVIVQAPGAGDEMQGLKAGVLEIGDIFVLNKCDFDGVQHALAVLTEVSAARRAVNWCPPVLRTVAVTGTGVDEVGRSIEQHQEWLSATGELESRRRRRVATEVLSVARAELDRRALTSGLTDSLLRGRTTPTRAARMLLAESAGRIARESLSAEPGADAGVQPARRRITTGDAGA